MLRRAGWRVNHKRVERLWRREGLKVPKRHPRWRRLWSGDGFLCPSSCNVEIFDTLFEAKVLVERWRREYNTLRPHSSRATSLHSEAGNAGLT